MDSVGNELLPKPPPEEKPKTQQHSSNQEGATEDLFAKIKRPYTVEDVDTVLKGFFAFEQLRIAKGATWVIGDGQFYEFLTSGKFFSKIPDQNEDKSTERPTNKEGYDSLLLFAYRTWRDNLVVNRQQVVKSRPGFESTIDALGKLPIPKTGEEVRDLYRKVGNLNDISGVSYQEGLSGEFVENPFLHFKGHRMSGYRYEQPEIKLRIYINPPIDAIPQIAQRFMEEANERGIPFYFKLIDYSMKDANTREILKRQDRMVFYSDKVNTPKTLKILEEIKGDHLEWFAERSLPSLSAKVMEGIGIAEDPSEYQDSKFSPFGKSSTSFSLVRAKFLRDVWIRATADIVRTNSEFRPRGGRTFRQIFNDHIPQKDKQYRDSLWKANLDKDGLGLRDWETQRALENALARTMIDVLPFIARESILPFIERQIRLRAPEYDINPHNLALNNGRVV